MYCGAQALDGDKIVDLSVTEQAAFRRSSLRRHPRNQKTENHPHDCGNANHARDKARQPGFVGKHKPLFLAQFH